MEIKVGQWFRHQNYILKSDKHMTIYGDYYHNEFSKSILIGHDEVKNLKVANTPQELIEVGDLVSSKLHNDVKVIQIFDEIKQLAVPYNSINFHNITKILTPNSNGGYDLQWEVE